MNKLNVNAYSKKILSDTLTPVSIYLKIRDTFPNSFLLESADSHCAENSMSFICFNPVRSYTVQNNTIHLLNNVTGEETVTEIKDRAEVLDGLQSFINNISINSNEPIQGKGVFGYMSYDAVQYFEDIDVGKHIETDNIPQLAYSFFKNVIAINHFKNEATLYCFSEGEDNLKDIEELIRLKNSPVFSFKKDGETTSNLTDEQFLELVKKGKHHCRIGDVFQIVLSRKFKQNFKGDEFNVYRALRSVNPSPYLFYFDYGNFKIFGSSPEAQIVVTEDRAYINPIAGTFRRTGNDQNDEVKAKELANDPKENAEHVMLVDLARNDLSTFGTDVKVENYKEVHFYSHVIHLVSKVSAKLKDKSKMLQMAGATFPAGTLSGAPKYKAMQLIEKYETTNRQLYGGAIGFIGLDGTINHAIIIRSFLSRNNILSCQAGAGVVDKSLPENELQEVYNKLAALNKALEIAEDI